METKCSPPAGLRSQRLAKAVKWVAQSCSRLVVMLMFLFGEFSVQASDLLIDQPQALANLEKRGFSLSSFVFQEASPSLNNQDLYAKNRNFRTLADTLISDLKNLKAKDPQLSISMQSSHRLFDSEWLRAKTSFFELVGVVNRMDRLSFHAKTCGELRFIYRLAYRTDGDQKVYSRLPMTINAVFWIPKLQGNCQKPAQNWKQFLKWAGQEVSAQERSAFVFWNELKTVEVNLQSVRWPSTVRPDMAGYAEYILRVFQRKEGQLHPSPLENTIDVAKIRSDSKLKAELLAWIKDPSRLKAIDQGIATIPDRFLAVQATSVALHGVHRLKNAPFSQVFKKKDFESIRWKDFENMQSPLGLIRRLNDLSCVGCHQGRTVAGFHFLGRDPSEVSSVNSIFVSASPHFLLDQPRRKSFFAALEMGKDPVHQRPLSVRAAEGEGRMGSHCGLGDVSFSKWTCENGFHCLAAVGDQIISPTGICVPDEIKSGSPCELGAIFHSEDSWKDRLSLKRIECGNSQICETSNVGFPNGMCSRSCDQLKKGEVCGSIADLTRFNQCLTMKGAQFSHCLSKNVRPGVLQECDEKNFCRDDYICARTSSGQGACIPPYFLFQLRVDGHQSPGLQRAHAR